MFEAETLTLAQSVLDACRARGWRVATAESCTGGLVAGALTAIAGSSDIVERGFVAYSNEAKSELLGVAPETIAAHGAVSAETAAAMAEGAVTRAACGFGDFDHRSCWPRRRRQRQARRAHHLWLGATQWTLPDRTPRLRWRSLDGAPGSPTGGTWPACGRSAQLIQEFIMDGVVTAVSRSARHTLVKPNEESIRLLVGLGIDGDAHMGITVKHRSRVAREPNQPNLRQVHLIHAELHDELRERGFCVSAGQMGENVTTRGVDLLGLPAGARLHVGDTAVIKVTGLRNPCAQLDRIQPGLMGATLARSLNGNLVRKAGIMAVVLTGGDVRPGDPIRVELPAPPHRPLTPV
jgi:hypothetical protein